MRALTTGLLVAAATAAPSRGQDNVLVLLADDLGVDRIAAYGEHPAPATTPNLDQLAADGLLFRNCWVSPSCSNTRATLLTGRLPSRHGIGEIVKASDPAGLPLAEVTLFEMLDAGTGGAYACLALGKWHLGTDADGPLHPNDQGADWFAGSQGNLPGYWSWTKVVQGVPAPETGYATTVVVDDALAAIAAAPEPWLAWVGFHAAHKPLHAPPADLHTVDLAGKTPQTDPVDFHRAMIEALDTEIGRLLAGLDPDVRSRTTVVFLSDNGTPGPLITPPFVTGAGKATPYEGGINVPLIVAGPGVAQPGAEVSGLVGATDLFATVAELAGVDLATALPGLVHDGVSFLPYLTDPAQPSLRPWVYAEGFTPNGFGPYVRYKLAIREAQYKLVWQFGGNGVRIVELFDLAADPFEQADLLAGPLTPEQLAVFLALTAEAKAIYYGI